MMHAIALHILAVTIWVGGMFFAYMALRPVAADLLEPPIRLTLWVGVFKKFFPWVWVSIVSILLTGFWVILNDLGGMKAIPPYINLMMGLGTVMVFIFMHVFFAPFKRLKQSVTNQDWPAGGAALSQIRTLVGINTMIGLTIIVIAVAGKGITF